MSESREEMSVVDESFQQSFVQTVSEEGEGMLPNQSFDSLMREKVQRNNHSFRVSDHEASYIDQNES